jgi:AraC-like DNA-binding protein/quercetin dioxygenase-like cupin family protein
MTSKSVKSLRQKVFEQGDFPVKVYVSSGKEYEPIPAHYHSDLELHLICHGSGLYSISGVNYQFEKNSVLVIHKNEVHSPSVGSKGSIKNISLILAARVLKNRPAALAALQSLETVHHLILTDTQAAAAECLLMWALEECEHKDLHWKGTIVNYIEALLAVLQRASLGHLSGYKDKDPLMQEILSYLNSEFTETISLIEVANRFGLSSYTLSKSFKRYVGMGFREYLIQLRVNEARKLLESTNMTVSAIAYQVGFGSLSAFNSDFLRLTGVTPGAYRVDGNPAEPGAAPQPA